MIALASTGTIAVISAYALLVYLDRGYLTRHCPEVRLYGWHCRSCDLGARSRAGVLLHTARVGKEASDQTSDRRRLTSEAKTKPTDRRTAWRRPVTSLIVLVATAAFLLLACEQAAPPVPPYQEPPPGEEPPPPPEVPPAPPEPDTEPTFDDATVPGSITEDVYVWDATDSSGRNATRTSLYYAAGEAIPLLTLPEARGGNGILSYSLIWSASVYQNELTFDQATRTISGTPVRVRAYGATYRATDEDGDTATLEFLIWISVPCEATVRGGCALPPSPGSGPARAVSIEVVFSDDVPGFIRDTVLSAARWWESAFTADFGSPMTVYAGDSCGDMVFDETRVVDDLLIAVSMFDPPDEIVIDDDGYWIPSPAARGGPCARRDNGLPYLGTVKFSTWGLDTLSGYYEDWFHPREAARHRGYNLARHEMAHALGFGASPRWRQLVRDGAFHGPAAMAEYGGPVPTNGVGTIYPDIHWDSDEFLERTGSALMIFDIMASARSVVLAVTLAAFQDLGFAVDYSVAELPACETKHHSLFRPGDCFDLPGIYGR